MVNKKNKKNGSTISFYDYMNFVLNDQNDGYYGGTANLGSRGNYVTSPSMSDDFAFLLSKQIDEWLIQIKNILSIDENYLFLSLELGTEVLCVESLSITLLIIKKI